MDAFLKTFGLVFLAEIADKSRIAGLMLVGVYRARWPVFLGMTLGYALLDGLGIAAGASLPGLFSGRAMLGLLGLLFLGFGAATFLFHEEAESGAKRWIERHRAWGPFTVSFLAIAASEFADRTQLAAAGLAAETGRPWAVYAGAMSALTILNALTVWLGQALFRKVPAALVHRAAAICFLLIGLAFLIRAIQ